MATQVSYSTNPSTYQSLLAAGVSPAQIREAINSGLNPLSLPPEYFGLSGGFTAPPAGGGAPPGLGGIDIPPATMGDPYSPGSFSGSVAGGSAGTGLPVSASGGASVGDPFGGAGAGGSVLPTASLIGFPIVDMSGGSTGAFGTTTNFGFPSAFDLGSLPSATNSYLGVPGSYSPSFTPDPSGAGFAGSGSLPYSEPSPIPFSDTGSPSVGGSMSLGGYGPNDAIDPNLTQPGASSGVFGGIPASPAEGYNYYDAGGGTTYVYDGDWNYLYTTSGSPFEGATAGGSAGTSPNPFAGASAGGSAGTQVNPNGTAIPSSNIGTGATGGFGVGAGAGYGVTPAGFSTGYTPFGGGGTGPQFSGGGSFSSSTLSPKQGTFSSGFNSAGGALAGWAGRIGGPTRDGADVVSEAQQEAMLAQAQTPAAIAAENYVLTPAELAQQNAINWQQWNAKNWATGWNGPSWGKTNPYLKSMVPLSQVPQMPVSGGSTKT
jgi:hypothetical protein